MKTQDYFAFLKTRFEQRRGKTEEMRIRIGSAGIRLIFSGIRPTEIMRLNLRLLESGGEECTETVRIWEDDIAYVASLSMVPEEERIIHYHQNEDYHIFYPGAKNRLSVRDNRNRETYVLLPSGEGFPRSYSNKPFVNEIQWWLWEESLLVHGAAVAAGGKGALITAPSGKGKSTLALACLLLGMDYVAEDYVLISRNGPLTGSPVFSTGNLVPDTLELLPELKRHILYFDDERGKYLIDLSEYSRQFLDGISLDCIIYPNLTGDEKPSIQREESVHPFVSAMTAAARQIKSQKRTGDAFSVLFRRLKGLPAYTLRLSRDPMENARALKAFLECSQTWTH